MTAAASGERHLAVLDGWRGISILCVLASHLVPLGHWGNLSIGLLGMVLFFNLSGFLITSFLLRADATVSDFLLRRIFRIVPLAWLFFTIVFAFQHESVQSWFAHYLFYANLPPPQVRLATDHMWSLCVEAQFYAGVALLFAIFRQRGLMVLPLLALAFTGLRILHGVPAATVTWYRIDEILAGCTLALLYHGRFGRWSGRIRTVIAELPQWPLLALLVLSCVDGTGYGEWFEYARPYLGALLVGATLFNRRTTMVAALDRRVLYYLATVSYAVYVIHGGLSHTWLGTGDLVEKYAKRPLLLLAIFGLAHLSTFYFERPFIALGRRLSLWVHARTARGLEDAKA